VRGAQCVDHESTLTSGDGSLHTERDTVLHSY